MVDQGIIRFAKIVIAGDPAVGKTSLRARYLGHGFKIEYMQTLGADFAIYETPIGGTAIRWQIWDLAGHAKFDDVLKRFYYGSFGAVVVYDATRAETRENIFSWVRDIWAHSTYREKIPIVLLGNKIDLKDLIVTKTEIGEELGKSLALERGGPVPHFETSAKTGHMVKEAFDELGRLVIEFTNKLPADQE
ncbi:MAG: Rab family GTPase [Candidatus Heimdallarchaeota archaeon]